MLTQIVVSKYIHPSCTHIRHEIFGVLKSLIATDLGAKRLVASSQHRRLSLANIVKHFVTEISTPANQVKTFTSRKRSHMTSIIWVPDCKLGTSGGEIDAVEQGYKRNSKNSIRDGRTPQPGEIFFNTMRYRSSETVFSLGYFQNNTCKD